MGKLSLLSLSLLFSMFFFLAKGSRVQLENFESKSDFPDQVKQWYADLPEKQLTTSKFTVYLYANNANNIQVAHSLVPGSTPSFFGDIYAVDYLATAEQDVNSEYLGAGQGFYVENSQEQYAAWFGINLSLTKFSNSTIIFQGQDRSSDKYKELAVIGGTGDFRLATGSAIYIVYGDTDNAILEFTVIVRYHGRSRDCLMCVPSSETGSSSN